MLYIKCKLVITLKFNLIRNRYNELVIPDGRVYGIITGIQRIAS